MNTPLKDRLLNIFIKTAALAAGLAVCAVFGFLFLEVIPFLRTHHWAAFFQDNTWAPSTGQFNMAPMLAGTVLVAWGAMILVAPLGAALAIFTTRVAPRPIARAGRLMLWVMAGVPSVVYGFWGLQNIVPLIQKWRAPGLSLLCGVIVLTVMTLPTMALLAEVSFKNLPPAVWQGAMSLGLSRWGAVWRVALPAAQKGLFQAALLSLARVMGETMAVIMVMGNTIQVPQSFLDPARALTAHIALEMAYALGPHRQALLLAGVLLLMMVSGVMILARGDRWAFLGGKK